MGEQECFTCGAKRKIDTFRYVVEDKGVSGSAYYVCNTKCLADLAASEREFNADDDYLDTLE